MEGDGDSGVWRRERGIQSVTASIYSRSEEEEEEEESGDRKSVV